jgi:RNA-binding protein
MSLSPEQRREYRAIAHNLKPVIIVGDKGLSEGLQEELERALNDHELIKIKVASQDRETRHEAITALCESSGAELVQTIGKIAVILRRAKKPNPNLSNLLRHKH